MSLSPWNVLANNRPYSTNLLGPCMDYRGCYPTNYLSRVLSRRSLPCAILLFLPAYSFSRV